VNTKKGSICRTFLPEGLLNEVSESCSDRIPNKWEASQGNRPRTKLQSEGSWSVEDMETGVLGEQTERDFRSLMIPRYQEDWYSRVRDVFEGLKSHHD
jgi:hypothetical protein